MDIRRKLRELWSAGLQHTCILLMWDELNARLDAINARIDGLEAIVNTINKKE